jgi:adenine-specific DNA-methyltransferase
MEFRPDHEFVLCYGGGCAVKFRGRAKDLTKYSNPDGDPSGPWMSDNLTGLANASERPNLHYEVVNPRTQQRYAPHPSRGWIYGPERMQQLIAAGRILWPNKPLGRPRLKRYMTDMRAETTGFSTLLDAPANVVGTKELSEILGPKVFAFPKPSGFVKSLLEQVTDARSIVLDSFAGSGTTAHAVAALNEEDGGARRFILVEMEEQVARGVNAERLRSMRPHGATHGGFRYVTLGEPLFNEDGQLRGEVKFAELAAHVFFTETGEPLPGKVNGKRSPLIGICRGTAYYLLFNGILGDKRPGGGNVLTGDVLAELPPHDGPRVVFGEACRLGEARLKREGVTFRQIPYQIKVS